MYQTILTIIHLDAEHQLSLARAITLAEATGARLQLVAIAYDPAGAETLFHRDEAGHALVRRRHVDATRDRLQALATRHGMTTSVDVRWGHPFSEAILEAVAAHRADLVVMQPRNLDTCRLSTTEWHLFRKCPVPIWLARAHHFPAKPRILAAVDPMDTHLAVDTAISEHALAATEALQGDLQVLHAAGEIPYIIGVAQEPGAYQAELLEVRERQLQRRLPPRVVERAQLQVVFDEPDDALLIACTEQEINLLVLGVLARRHLANLLIGETAQSVLARTSCDALLIKDAEH